METKLPKISEREKEIMSIFWHTGKSMTSSAIAEGGNELSINTVQAAMRNLMKKGYIKVDDIVYSGTVLTRCYIPIISAEQYAAYHLQTMRANAPNFSTLNFIDHIVKNNDTTILDELEDIIKRKKEQEDD
jgi:predicted transcriptional regulator